MPKALKYIIFLVFVLGIFATIPFMLHMVGIHCDSQKHVVKSDWWNGGVNYEISQLGAKDVYNSSAYVPQGQNFFAASLDTCVYYLKFKSSSILGDQNYMYCPSTNTSGCVYALRAKKSGLWFWRFDAQPSCLTCSNYSYINIVSESGSDSIIPISSDYYCFSDAYPNNKTGCTDACDIPLLYVWNSTSARAVCNSPLCTGTNTTAIYTVDILLQQVDAQPFYSTNNNKDYSKAVGIKCDNNLNPQISAFGIPVFDYRIWILLMVLGAMFYWYVRYIRH
jgi:hypothetical protein